MVIAAWTKGEVRAILKRMLTAVRGRKVRLSVGTGERIVRKG